MERLSARYDSAVDVARGTKVQIEAVELAGRCEAVARFALLLAAKLEDAGFIDGPGLSRQLRQTAGALTFPGEHREPAQRTLYDLAGQLDQARRAR